MQPTSGTTGSTTPPPEEPPVVRPKTSDETGVKEGKKKKKKVTQPPVFHDISGTLTSASHMPLSEDSLKLKKVQSSQKPDLLKPSPKITQASTTASPSQQQLLASVREQELQANMAALQITEQETPVSETTASSTPVGDQLPSKKKKKKKLKATYDSAIKSDSKTSVSSNKTQLLCYLTQQKLEELHQASASIKTLTVCLNEIDPKDIDTKRQLLTEKKSRTRTSLSLKSLERSITNFLSQDVNFKSGDLTNLLIEILNIAELTPETAIERGLIQEIEELLQSITNTTKIELFEEQLLLKESFKNYETVYNAYMNFSTKFNNLLIKLSIYEETNSKNKEKHSFSSLKKTELKSYGKEALTHIELLDEKSMLLKIAYQKIKENMDSDFVEINSENLHSLGKEIFLNLKNITTILKEPHMNDIVCLLDLKSLYETVLKKIDILPEHEKETTGYLSLHDPHATKMFLTYMDLKIFLISMFIYQLKQAFQVKQ